MPDANPTPAADPNPEPADKPAAPTPNPTPNGILPVSYTHLTLPTIYSV